MQILMGAKEMLEKFKTKAVADNPALNNDNYQRYSALVVQVSPYPPEAGSDYHEQLAHEVAQELKAPVIVLAGLTHLNPYEAVKQYGIIEKDNNVVVYRAFWAPRIAECRNITMVLKHIVASLKALAQTITIAKKYAKKVVAHFHYGPTTWPGGLLGEHYPLGMLLARLLGAKVMWTIHAFLTPYQLLREVKERKVPLLLTLLLLVYYLLLAEIAAKACHKIIVLVDTPKAQITNYLSKLLGKSKIVEQIHPPFKPLARLESKPKNKVTITCLGYIRREKGYHYLLQWLTDLKNKNPDLYNRIEVVIAGAVDRKKREDLEYLRNLLHIKYEQKLDNVRFLIKRLSKEEFHKILAESTIVWCAYDKKYGPSGILAWARAYSKKVLYITNLWGYSAQVPYVLDAHEHYCQMVKLYLTCVNL